MCVWYVCACMCVRFCVCVCACARVRVRARECARVAVNALERVFVCVVVCASVCARACACGRARPWWYRRPCAPSPCPSSLSSGAPRGRSGWSGGRAGPKMGQCLPPPERRRGGRGRAGAAEERGGEGAEVAAVGASSCGRQCVGFPGCLRARLCAWVVRACVCVCVCVCVRACACVCLCVYVFR